MLRPMTPQDPRMARLPRRLLSLVILAAFQSEPAEAQDIGPLQTAAEQGDANAQFNLGLRYDDGDGVPENDREAVRWYRMAADQGHAAAQFTLGTMYSGGRDVPENDQEAVKWYRMAADQGHVDAQFDLGVMYANGEGVPKDYVKAYAWSNLAAAQRQPLAARQKTLLRSEMSAKQVDEAQKLSSELWERIGRGKSLGEGSGSEAGDGGRVYRYGESEVTNPVPIVQTTPSYTQAAQAAKVQGVVWIQAIIRKDGRLDCFKVIRGLGHGLDEEAIREIETNWRFQPGRLNGKPVDVLATIEVQFNLR